MFAIVCKKIPFIKLYKYISTQILPILFTCFLSFETTLIVSTQHLLFTLQCLKKHIKFQYKILSCISGIDFLNTRVSRLYRFAIVYELLSLSFNNRLKVKIFLNETTLHSSVVSIYINSNWWEREIWDMFGIWFERHPDLRRILTDYGFNGFPLRKDFPVCGFVEVIYDFRKKRIVSRPLELSQDFRSFSFENIW